MLREKKISGVQWAHLLVLTVSLTLIAINVLRMIRVPVTFDECDFALAKTQSYTDIFFHFTGTANNHILNTFFEKLFMDAFGGNLFALRAGSLLAQLIFLLFSYLLCKRLFNKPIWLVSAFLVLNLQPFMFEFWGLARGYGLAIAFMTGSIYYLFAYRGSQRIYLLLLSLFFSLLAVLANFTLLNFYCGLIAAFIFSQLLARPRQSNYKAALKEIVSVAAASVGLLLLIYTPIKKLVADGQFFYGGEKGIVQDTVRSLIRSGLYTADSVWVGVAAYTSAIVFFFAGIYWLVCYRRRLQHAVLGMLLWVLLAVPLVAVIVQHWLLHTRYLLDRTGLFLVVLFMLHFAYWLSTLNIKRGQYSNLLACMFAIPFVFNFVCNIGTRSTQIWQTDAYNIAMLNKIVAQKGTGEKARLCVHWIFYPSVSYYLERQYRDHFYPLRETSSLICTDTAFDYYYLPGIPPFHPQVAYDVDTIFTGGIYFMPGADYVLFGKK